MTLQAIRERKMANAVLSGEPQWRTINHKQIESCFAISKLAQVRSVLSICTNSLFSGGLNFSGNSHVDSMSPAIKKEFTAYYVQHGRAALEIDYILGFVPQTWDYHPVFGALPQHMDLSQVELQVCKMWDGRVRWRGYEITKAPGAYGISMGSSYNSFAFSDESNIGSMIGRRPINRLHVYVSHAPDSRGNLDSIMMAILNEYNYLSLIKSYALRAYNKMSNPNIITEALESKHDPEMLEGQDFASIAKEINGITPNSGGTGDQQRAIAQVASLAVLKTLNSDKGADIVANRARTRNTPNNSGGSTGDQPDIIPIGKGRKVAKADAVSKAPEILEKQEMFFRQQVYDLLQVPSGMIGDGGSKIGGGKNENAKQIYDEGQEERHLRIETIFRGIYNEMHWDQNVAAYLKGKVLQFEAIKRRMKGIMHEKDHELHCLLKGKKRRRPTEGEETRGADDLLDGSDSEDDSDGSDSEDELDEFLMQSISPQEAYNFTNIEVHTRRAPSLATTVALYKLGWVTPEGMHDAIKVTLRYPDFYIPKSPLIDLEKALGIEEDEDALSGNTTTLTKSGTKKVKKKPKAS